MQVFVLGMVDDMVRGMEFDHADSQLQLDEVEVVEVVTSPFHALALVMVIEMGLESVSLGPTILLRGDFLGHKTPLVLSLATVQDWVVVVSLVK